MESDVRRIKKQRVVYLALSAATLLFLGLIYAFSMFALPMTEDFNLSGNVGLTFYIMIISVAFGAILGSVLDKRFGVRLSLLASAVLFAIGFIGAGILGSITNNVIALYVFYGLFGGFGAGIGYNTIIATTNVWFPDKVGFSSGVMLMAFGISSLVVGNIALMLRASLGSMGTVLIIVGCSASLVTIILASILKKPPSNVVELMVPESSESSDSVSEEKTESMFKTPIFYLYYGWAIILLAIGLVAIGSCAADAVLVGIDVGFASLLVGLVGTCNGAARILIGLLFDRTNIRVTMFTVTCIGVTATVCIVFAFITSASALYIVGALLCGLSYGGTPVVSSAFARQRFGAAKYPFNLSVTNFAAVFASLLNIAIGAFAGQDNRLTIFTIMMILSFYAIVQATLFALRWKKDLAQT